MKNPMAYYAAVGLGIIALAAGAYLIATGHHISSYASLGVGAILVIAGVVGTFVMKPKASTK